MLRFPIALLRLLTECALCSNSCLGSNDYWFGVRTTTGLLLEQVVVCIQTTIGLPSNDYWFAPRPHIATQPSPLLFALHPHQADLFPAQFPPSTPAYPLFSRMNLKIFSPLVTLLLKGK